MKSKKKQETNLNKSIDDFREEMLKHVWNAYWFGYEEGIRDEKNRRKK